MARIATNATQPANGYLDGNEHLGLPSPTEIEEAAFVLTGRPGFSDASSSACRTTASRGCAASSSRHATSTPTSSAKSLSESIRMFAPFSISASAIRCLLLFL